jgi:hypothetical protein
MRENFKTQRLASYGRLLCLKDRKAEAEQISPLGRIPIVIGTEGKGINVNLQTKKRKEKCL